MRSILKKIIPFAAAVCIAALSGGYCHAAPAIPEEVRIGLFFQGTQAGSVTIGAENGLKIGAYNDGSFKMLCEYNSNEKITVRKDAYYVSSNGDLKEYDPDSSQAASGEKTGPFHVQVGEDCEDYAEAVRQAEMMKQKGIPAYPVYSGKWQVWVGFYSDSKTARSAITVGISAILGQGSYSVIEPASNRIILTDSGKNTVLMFNGSTEKLRIDPMGNDNEALFSLNGKRYRGGLEAVRLAGSDMTIINVVPFEQYLYGVVPCEIGAYPAKEAIKAQAVAARTYAMVSMGQHGKLGFDLCATQHCQVYGGADKEAAACTNAVNETKGKIVTYDGRPAQTLYFASSGGRTEDSENVWGGSFPYLKSVEDKYELTNSANYYWTKSYSNSELSNIIKSKGRDLGSITGVSVLQYTAAGRALEVQVEGTNDKYIYIREAFKSALGLKSGMFTISTDADISARKSDNATIKLQAAGKKAVSSSGIKTVGTNTKVTVMGADGVKKTFAAYPTGYVFTGKGWGHGVGMSQEGAMGMAEAGFTYDQILEYYYTGAKVE
ncbi:stage II sporulation protein D [Anaerobacterium chartisolvens]|uniref:Stage II sporulation protein D n=1 Tax=Anaerobacterium chartisolvens TaxID=1297424 RepID=A0A369AWS5_9FIRM|nr:SpoIID/LytB domain-containing protein [Anaerobacterium chartisolvens]RCX13832.1 stage II sporulation protein D [Anaerobacterium chartisolvens]